MEAYSGFAGVYDLLMDDYDYSAWTDYYIDILNRADCYPKTVCDCACGTGSISIELARRGMQVIGADISEEMLQQAADKSRKNAVQIRYIRQNMCQLNLPKPVDAITCACDGLNYVLKDKDVESFFKCAYRNLNAGGVLAFDISSQYKLTQVLGDAFYGEEREDVVYLWQNSLKDDIVTMDLTFFLKTDFGLYERRDEVHRQRAHSPENLRTLLSNDGFADIRIYGDRTFEEPKDDEMRIHITAKKI